MRRGFDLGFVYHDERGVIEVAAGIRFRIDEEALGATFHNRVEATVEIVLELEWFFQYATRLLED